MSLTDPIDLRDVYAKPIADSVSGIVKTVYKAAHHSLSSGDPTPDQIILDMVIWHQIDRCPTVKEIAERYLAWGAAAYVLGRKVLHLERDIATLKREITTLKRQQGSPP